MPHRSSRAVAGKNQGLVWQGKNLGLDAVNQGVKIAAWKVCSANTFKKKYVA